MLEAYADGSLRNNEGSIGYIVYDGDDVILHKRKIVKCTNTNTLEYIALRELLKELNLMGMTDILIRSDCKNIISGIKRNKVSCSMAKKLIREMNKYENRKIKYIKSSKNKAHKVCRGEYDPPSTLKIEYTIPEPERTVEQVPEPRDEREELKMVIRYRKHLLLKCPTCKELKAASEFPRYKKSKGHRKCSSCANRLQLIN